MSAYADRAVRGLEAALDHVIDPGLPPTASGFDGATGAVGRRRVLTWSILLYAVSAFAAGVTWRIMYQQEPDRGAINAAIGSVQGIFSPAGVLSQAAYGVDLLGGRVGEQALQIATIVKTTQNALLGVVVLRGRWRQALALERGQPASRPAPGPTA